MWHTQFFWCTSRVSFLATLLYVTYNIKNSPFYSAYDSGVEMCHMTDFRKDVFNESLAARALITEDMKDLLRKYLPLFHPNNLAPIRSHSSCLKSDHERFEITQLYIDPWKTCFIPSHCTVLSLCSSLCTLQGVWALLWPQGALSLWFPLPSTLGQQDLHILLSP